MNTSTPDESLVHDADLLAELEAARGKFAFDVTRRHIIAKQEKRDADAAAAAEKAATLAGLSSVQRKRTTVKEAVQTGEAVTRDNLQHIHSVLALCALPHNKQPLATREYERRQGNSSLVVEAGKLMTDTGKWEAQPLPYGSRARLLLLHLCSEAIRQKSATIEVADSLTAFIRDMGFEVSGGRNGSLTYFKQQLNALAACRLRVGTWGPRGASTIDTKPFSKMEVWLPDNPDQHMLWSSKITFSNDFFEDLSRHALPVNKYVARAFANSSRKLDFIYWLGYQINRLEKPLILSWDNLQLQFGEGFSTGSKFRQSFKKEMADILAVLPKAPLAVSERGLTVFPAAVETLALPTPRKFKKA